MKAVFASTLALSMLFLTACGSSSTGSSSANAASASGSAVSSDDPATIIWGNYGSSAMPQYSADQDAAAYIQENSNIKVDYQADGVLGGESDMMQQVMDGTIQCVTVSTSSFNTYTELFEAFQLPFLIGDYESEYKVLTSDEAKAIFDQVGEELGLKVVGIGENGMRQFANNVRPITCVADLKGMKLRIATSNMLKEVMGNLGVNPVSVPYSDVYSALQTKVVDGEEINMTSIYAMNHYEVLKYISEIGLYPFPTLLVMNLDFWNGLSADQQEAILTGMDQGAQNLFNKYLPEYEDKASEACKEAGVQINVIEGDARQEFVNIATKTWDEYRAKDQKISALIDMAQSLK